MSAEVVVILGTAGAEPTWAVCNRLIEAFPDVNIVYEQRESRAKFLRRRIKRLGWLRVAGQVAFQLVIVPSLRALSARRIAQIKNLYRLRTVPVPGPVVSSINSQEAIDLVASLKPSCIVVAGTRIIGKDFLERLACPIVNLHAGITPLYRGVHGAYWSLVERRPELCGVTVHYVDAGIDTGKVLAQGVFRPRPADNFVTYPWVQLGLGTQLLVKLLPEVIARRAEAVQPMVSNSKLRTHPTIWGYCWHRLLHGVK